MASASDVPGKYDLVLNGEGYRFADREQRRAAYSYSPLFVQRQNVQGDFGDNQQDFWLTATQRDWSLGEQQKFFRQAEGRDQRFWQGTKLDIMTAGQAMIESDVASLSFASAVRSCATRLVAAPDSIYATSAANLRSVNASKTLTDHGAHGLGTTPDKFGMCSDGSDLYITGQGGGTVGVRKWDGSTFSTWSATSATTIAYLNNSLYGVRNNSSDLIRYSTSGTATTLFTWKQADGAIFNSSFVKIEQFGGRLAILMQGAGGFEVWIYDGTAPALIHRFPPNFTASDMLVAQGTIFCSGHFTNAAGQFRPALFYYSGGTVGLLWQADAYNAAGSYPAMCQFDGRVMFNDDTTSRLMMYDVVAGGVHSHGSFTVAGSDPVLCAAGKFLIHTRNQTTAYFFPDSAIASAATLKTSLIDFDSSLTKRFKGVRVDADIPAGATIDLAYRLEDVDGAYTGFQTGAANGMEYAIDQNGRAISIQITLNKGSSSLGPVLKRMYLRAAPLMGAGTGSGGSAFRRREYIIDCTGRDNESSIKLRDGTFHSKDGLTMATALNTAATATSPVSITDRFGTYTGIIDDGFELVEIRPEEFIARVRTREV